MATMPINVWGSGTTTTGNTGTWQYANASVANNPWMDVNMRDAFRSIEARMLATELQLALLAEKVIAALERLDGGCKRD